MQRKDYYKILGVDKNSSENDIKKAYRKLATKYHPDKFENADTKQKTEAENKFKEINEAYNVLSNNKEKEKYDNFGKDYYNFEFNDFKNFDFNDFRTKNTHYENINFDDIFKDLFGNKKNNTKKGNDLYYDLELTLEEISKDKIIEIKYQRNGKCKTCNGNGCGNCEKNGIQKEIVTKKITIPAGIKNEEKFLLRKGGNFIKNGSYGDLYVIIKIKEHKIFTRDNLDIHCNIEIPFTTAILGGEILVPTLEKDVKIKINSGTQCDTKLKLKGKGLKGGDEIINIKIKIPEKITKEQKELIEKYEKTLK